jgi:hypothetical protein
MKILYFFRIYSLLFIAALSATNSYSTSAKLTGSCGLLINVSKWGSPIKYGQVDQTSNHFLLLINFDAGTISGYANHVTFGANASEISTYQTMGSYNILTFTQSPDPIAGFYKLTPSNLDQIPEWKVLPVNGGNTYLLIWSANNRAGAGGTGVCQKL